MAARELRAVAPDEAPPRQPTVAEAAKSGDHRALLVAMRDRVALAVQDPKCPPRDLAALTRRLNEIAKDLYRKISQEEVTFLKPATQNNQEVTQKFDLVKYIIDTRMKEADEASQAEAIAQQRQQIMGLIARKEEEALAGKSIEELRELLKK